jgi:hypothetical protein
MMLDVGHPSNEQFMKLISKNVRDIHDVHCAGLSDFSVRGTVHWHFSQEMMHLFHRKFRRQNEGPISLRSVHPILSSRMLFSCHKQIF